MMIRLLVIAAFFTVLAGCNSVDSNEPESGTHVVLERGGTLDFTTPTTPSNEQEELAAAALRRAVVTEKDIPDYGLLQDKERIVLSNVTREGEALTAGAIPESGKVRFVLLSPERIQELANKYGDFLHLSIGRIDIEGDRAKVDVANTWAVAEDSEMIYLSGGGYTLIYERSGTGWRFVEVEVAWIS